MLHLKNYLANMCYASDMPGTVVTSLQVSLYLLFQVL